MPAASEGRPALPRTWRPLGVRLAVIVFGGLLVLVCAFAWFGFDASVRDRFTLFQRATLVLLAALFGAVGHALARSRVVAEADRLVVVNGYRRRELAWAEVLAVHLVPGAPWAVLDLADGSTASVLAIQGSDGDRARRAVREIRSLLEPMP